jgi:hypothetical protein
MYFCILLYKWYPQLIKSLSTVLFGKSNVKTMEKNLHKKREQYQTNF